MNKIPLILCLLVMLLFAPLHASAKRSAKEPLYTTVAFDKTKHDFGTILRERRKYNCVFRITNNGDQPLVILKIQTSCSCLKAHYSRRPIMPSESAYIRVSIEAEKIQVGIFHRAIELYSNAGLSVLTVEGISVPK